MTQGKEHQAKSQAHGARVLIGMTGGIDSTVAAFLLKKQGYECIGVGIHFLDKEKIKERLKPKEGDEEEVLKSLQGGVGLYDERIKFLEGHTSLDDMEKVKKVCDALSIPFYAIRATAEYQYYVLDQMVGQCLDGATLNPCVWESFLMMDLLLQRSVSLKASFIATGHYAKVYHHDQFNCFEIFAAADTENDQSYLLSRLTQEHLSKLIFPLSELWRKDVMKIAESFKLPCSITRDSKKICFYDYGDLSSFVEGYSTKDLRIEGKILDLKTFEHVGDHSGIHHCRVGQSVTSTRGIKGFHVMVNPLWKVCLISSTGNIYVGEEGNCAFQECLISDIYSNSIIDTTKYLSVFAQCSLMDKKVEATLLFKNNGTAKVVFKRPIVALTRGQHITFYSGYKAGSRVICCGRVHYIGRFDRIDRLERFRPQNIDENDPEAQKLLKQLFDSNRFGF